MIEQERVHRGKHLSHAFKRAALGGVIAGAVATAAMTLPSADAAQHHPGLSAPIVTSDEATPAATAASGAAAAPPMTAIPSPAPVSDLAPAASPLPNGAPTPTSAPADTSSSSTPTEPQLNPGPGGPPILVGPSPC